MQLPGRWLFVPYLWHLVKSEACAQKPGHSACRAKKAKTSGPLMLQMSMPVVQTKQAAMDLRDINTDGMEEVLDALELLDLVNGYRAEKNLQPVEISPALMAVSFAHVKDLNENSRRSGCNMHSWSHSQAEWWSGCCYTPDHAEAGCMWSKGKEITSCWGVTRYAGNIYENAYSGPSSPSSAFTAWKGSSAHRAVMVNEGIWSRFNPWPAVGAAMSGNYAVLIFGDRRDRSGAFSITQSYPHCGPEDYRPVFNQRTTTQTSTRSSATTTQEASTTSAASFLPADGGVGKACRNFEGRNSETFYTVKGVSSLSECQSECGQLAGCTGVEYSRGRCELWTTAIGATKDLAGFSCYRYNLPSLEPVDGGEDRACRGAQPNDNSPEYYRKYTGPTSLDACWALCATHSGCKGVEFSIGRCEVWLRGIEASKALPGFSCMRVVSR